MLLKVYSDEPRGLYALESHRKRNLSNIARVIRTPKGPYPGFCQPPPPQNGMSSGNALIGYDP